MFLRIWGKVYSLKKYAELKDSFEFDTLNAFFNGEIMEEGKSLFDFKILQNSVISIDLKEPKASIYSSLPIVLKIERTDGMFLSMSSEGEV
jgi:AAA+ superfamily predicted ATPase